MNGTLRADSRLRSLEEHLNAADVAFERAYRSLAGEGHGSAVLPHGERLGPRWRSLLTAQARRRSAEELLFDHIELLLDAWERR